MKFSHPDTKGLPLSDNREFARTLAGPRAKAAFWAQVARGYLAADLRLLRSLAGKSCFVGPFKGEYGNFLSYVLPFLSWLAKRGVAIHYCGLELHKPLMINESGEPIYASFEPLRDYFAEKEPNTNVTEAPRDVEAQSADFVARAQASGQPFWNLADNFFYWHILRNWALDRRVMSTFDLGRRYRDREELAVALFPRKKGSPNHPNNGGPWDYERMAAKLATLFDRVYIVGHPSLSHEVAGGGKVEACLTADNAEILRRCARGGLILTPHSGTVYLGAYLRAQVLILYQGQPPIGSLQNTLRFFRGMGGQPPFAYAYSEAELLEYCEHFARERRERLGLPHPAYND